MVFIGWIKGLTEKLRWYEVGVLKWTVLFATLLIAKLWPPSMSLYWKVYATGFLFTEV